MENPRLVIPVYLDVNALLDLLASLEGGFSLVEKITSRSQTSTASEVKGGTEFGIANVLNLLKISLTASGSRANTDVAAEKRETERFHTYGSLLHRLRQVLDTKK